MATSDQHIVVDFIAFFRERHLHNSKVLVAVSGGLDSVVLCALSKAAGLDFSIAHCNFQLRGEESERDEAFVKDLGHTYSVEVFVKRFDTTAFAEEKKFSIQEAARALRYDWFTELKHQRGFAFTVTAHHADDNMETLLMNFFRGTGLQGMTGMPGWNLTQTFVLRPLINVRRKELLAFAKEHQLKWVQDSSNASSKYTRNFFRNELIPAINKVFPQVEDNLLSTIERFKKIKALYDQSVFDLKEKILEHHLNDVRIPVLKLMRYKDTSLIYEIIKDYGFGEKQVEEVIKLADAESGKFIQNASYQIIRHGRWLVIAPTFLPGIETIAISKEDSNVHFRNGRIELQFIPANKHNIQKEPSIAQLDAKHIQFPLLLRRWKQGDYFYPLGMRKKKKLARFFIDQKLPKNEKENVWVLESNKKIIWIVGHRIDDRFKITDSTKEILLLTHQHKVVAL